MNLFNRYITFSLLICAAPYGAAHTLYIDTGETPDSSVIELKEVNVSYTYPSNSLGRPSAEGITLGAKALKKMTSFMGQNDPIRIMQSLPAVASNDVISGGIYVQGCENSHNLVTIDGAQVYNPSHLFGLFSVFNTPHFNTFDIRTDSHRAIDGNFIGAIIQGITSNFVTYRPSIEMNVGIIDSHFTIRTPLKTDKTSFTLSGRATYLNAIFGNTLKLDNAPIRYSFSDWNATYLQQISRNWKLKISGYLGMDNMKLPDPNYASNLKFGWSNAVASATFSESNKQSHTLALSTYSNIFDISYSDIKRRLPARLSDFSYSSFYKTKNINFSASAHIRNIKPQHTVSNVDKQSDLTKEISIGSDWYIDIFPKWKVAPGIKLSGYSAKSFHRFYPLPSFTSTLSLKEWLIITLNVSQLAQYTHKIEESTMGLPTDYWIGANSRVKPLTANCSVATIAGSLLNGAIAYSISGYYRNIRNMTDWYGILFNVLSDTYDPSVDIVIGKGRAWGIAYLLNISIGKIQGWISYNFGKSEMHVPDKRAGWRPTTHDRLHDINLTLSWPISKSIIASASWVYATGRPYTEPLYGYILGENLICEFKPLNSSRLPDMHRLDMSIDWTFWHKGNAQQGLTASVYNAYANPNTLFVSFDYSPDKGFYKKSMDFKAVIPYISYYLKF